jgi:hypothetical protein
MRAGIVTRVTRACWFRKLAWAGGWQMVFGSLGWAGADAQVGSGVMPDSRRM